MPNIIPKYIKLTFKLLNFVNTIVKMLCSKQGVVNRRVVYIVLLRLKSIVVRRVRFHSGKI